jgi:transposase-like protein
MPVEKFKAVKIKDNTLECPKCHATMNKKNISATYKGEELGKYDGYACDACGSTFLTEKAVSKILKSKTYAKALSDNNEGGKINE